MAFPVQVKFLGPQKIRKSRVSSSFSSHPHSCRQTGMAILAGAHAGQILGTWSWLSWGFLTPHCPLWEGGHKSLSLSSKNLELKLLRRCLLQGTGQEVPRCTLPGGLGGQSAVLSPLEALISPASLELPWSALLASALVPRSHLVTANLCLCGAGHSHSHINTRQQGARARPHPWS